MNKILLFFMLRFFFYLSVIALISAHPGIKISFDRIGILQWFIIIPLEALIAFMPERGKFTQRRKIITALAFLLPLSLLAGGFSPDILFPLLAGAVSFTLTYLLFFYPRFAKPAVLEPFFFAWVCLRLLALSRSGEEIAGQSIALTQFILVWTAVVFLLHSVVVYFCLFPKSAAKGAGKEGTIFFLGSAAALLLVLIVLPPDFVRNKVIENLKEERVPERIRSESEKGMPRDSGGRREGRRTLPRSGDERHPSLRGLPEYEWESRTGRGNRGDGGSQDNRQYLVKIVASEREPVYMGDAFRGQLDPVQGFLLSPQEQFNRLANQRFFATWFNIEPEYDTGRQRQEVFSLSTLPNKYLPWRPVSIDPTILSEGTGPLRYIHQVVSNTHLGDPVQLVASPSRPFNNFEKSMLAPYLELPLDSGDMERFGAYMNSALQDWQKDRMLIIYGDEYLSGIFFAGREKGDDSGIEPVNEYLEKILALLVSFSKYQYNLSYNDDYSISALKDFLFDSEEGDCVEFSNTLALLGRMAGVPSRVVTGFLAAESLQTEAHYRGLANLRARIPALMKFPFENLYMVTNLHAHSWTQFFIPDYGWLDFEATFFAKAPEGMGDFNTWDVVIPVMEENRVISQIRKFPWRAVLRAFAVLAACALAAAYVLRYGREALLFARAQQGGRSGARALYLLLLARLAADGKPIKPASKTATEYAQLFPGKSGDSHFLEFASLYSELRWREFASEEQREERFELLRKEYNSILEASKKRGLLHWFKRLLSLRGLAYL
uniref:Transglutaminase domain-containing protein n=1 Tax=uncultured bacterium 35A20 TaxID=1194347 RepID=K7PDX8_9BACT|nr:transglutaminase domain-containing protein [uncultured bacterium 35A20]